MLLVVRPGAPSSVLVLMLFFGSSFVLFFEKDRSHPPRMHKSYISHSGSCATRAELEAEGLLGL